MKIGVLTFHTSVNNCAVMQCYALTKRLRQEFPGEDVEVIDYRMPKVDSSYEATLKQYLSGGSILLKLKKLIVLIRNPGTLRWKKHRNYIFRSVLSQLPLSQKTIYDDSVEELFTYIHKNYDIVIAGSDAIWNYETRGFPNPYFLDDSLKCKKFSYAASCYGMSYERVPQNQKEKIKRILDSYTFLSTRDWESEKFLKEMGCNKTPVHTCDPTVFLNTKDLPVDEKKLKEKLLARGFDFNRPTIGIMGDNRMCAMVHKLYAEKYQIAALYNYCNDADVNLYDLTPYEWAFVFRYFRLTFTTFFHGTMLSLRNGIPVVCIALETEYAKKHMTKVEDFLVRVGMQDCYFETDYRQINIDAIRAKADELLSKDSKADICARMDREAETSKPFFDAIRIIINEETKND
ncbi:MAG: polysaccharide pyruvyl transferase family protein [Oscillospiraceae bacterium]|nr:polysaccharide pyruvyl transferase family protein [Oscillospiraceae bacterium]